MGSHGMLAAANQAQRHADAIGKGVELCHMPKQQHVLSQTIVNSQGRQDTAGGILGAGPPRAGSWRGHRALLSADGFVSMPEPALAVWASQGNPPACSAPIVGAHRRASPSFTRNPCSRQ